LSCQGTSGVNIAAGQPKLADKLSYWLPPLAPIFPIDGGFAPYFHFERTGANWAARAARLFKSVPRQLDSGQQKNMGPDMNRIGIAALRLAACPSTAPIAREYQ
jgi:hypothetical protein